MSTVTTSILTVFSQVPVAARHGETPPVDPAYASNVPLSLIRAKAAKGNAEAQNALGYALLHGINVERDPAAAMIWLKKAAARGNHWAKTNIGIMYANGVGIPPDPAESVRWLRSAISHGSGPAKFSAQTTLGILYLKGLGVPKSISTARGLFEQASQGGDVNALTNLGLMYQTGLGVPADAERARKLFRAAVDKGYAGAMTALGAMEINGEGRWWPDAAEGFRLFSRAAELGDDRAEFNLGLMYEKGKYVNANPEMAFFWYRKSAEQGNRGALEKLR